MDIFNVVCNEIRNNKEMNETKIGFSINKIIHDSLNTF